jgi:predicted nucleotidyltransferase
MGHLQLRSREGDFIETNDGLIFDVKGMVHPPDRVIAYLRYVPNNDGRRQRLGVKYRKVYDLAARRKLLRTKWPEYLYRDTVFNRELQGVPVANIKKHYLPTEKLAQLRRAPRLDRQQRLTVEMATVLAKEAAIPTTKIGVSGSILVDLHTPKSDIDLVLYGSRGIRKCYSKLQSLLNTQSQGFGHYLQRDLHKLYVRRGQSASMSYQIFSRHEQPKCLQGKYKGTEYFIRCVRDWNEWHENYGTRRYFPVGRSVVQATVSDDTESIFTPCVYRLVNAEATGKLRAPNAIISFRGRFCEQAHTGERIRARGSLERVVDKRRDEYNLVVGEKPGDYLMVVG